MKSNKAKEERSMKPEANYLAMRAVEAKKQAQAARKRARVAKAKFKAARKAFKEARKIAKQARKEAKVIAKALKAQTKPAPKPANNKGARQRRPKFKRDQDRVTSPRIIVEKPTAPSAVVRADNPAEPQTARSQSPRVGT